MSNALLPVGAALEVNNVVWDGKHVASGTAVITPLGLELQKGARVWETTDVLKQIK
jgi:hypothetical protein